MNTSSIPHPWTMEDVSRLDRSRTFRCIANVALDVIRRFEAQAVMVSGPMTTGGKGSLEENMRAYERAIFFLERKGVTVFNQLFAEHHFKRLWYEWRNAGGEGYCWPILNDFYEPVFRSGKIRGLYFMPDWQSSKGSTHERKLAMEIPLEITDLPLDWENQYSIAV